MFRWLHSREHGYTLLAVGAAFLALAVMVPTRSLSLVCVGASLVSFAAGGLRRLRGKRRHPEIPDRVSDIIARAGRRRDDGDDDDEEDRPDPYCPQCDEVYSPGTTRCLTCWQRIE